MKIRLIQYCRVIKEAVIEVSETEKEIKALLKSGKFWDKYDPEMVEDDTNILRTDVYNDETNEELYVQE